MSGGGGGGEEVPPPPPRNGGEFLLRLVQRQPQQTSSSVQPHGGGGGGVSLDPAVAAVGPTLALPANGHHYASPPDLLFHNHNHNHNHPCWPQQQLQQQQQQPSPFNPLVQFHPQRSTLMLGKMPFPSVHQDGPFPNLDFDLQLNNALRSSLISSSYNHNHNHNNKVVYNSPGPPPGFATTTTTGQPPRSRTGFEVPTSQTAFYKDPHPKSMLHSASPSVIDPSFSNAHASLVDLLDQGVARARRDTKFNMPPTWDSKAPEDHIGELSHQFGESSLVDEHHDNCDKKKLQRDKDFRSDPRGKQILSQKMRNSKSYIQCRSDIHRFDSRFLDIFESLIPASEEKAKQKQLLSVLEKLVCKEWPNARIYLYGSCANSFGVSKSDIDVCLAIADKNIDKSEVLLKLADILESDNLENVQALTRARVPIVKLKDPVTGISCDICINNVLAVVNTKLLHDYAEIDARLRQLAFIVKHWAKSRAVNETYQGTLSSYAYVLMCIHFLQQRRPAILPCLQEMDGTYTVTVDDVKCSYFDKVERLQNFGARNKESIAQLVWAFFNYWAYCHDYANSVISVRTGSVLSKQEKDWTRRIGNERHLICIEDPFETAHDLGRVVDKHSIRVLREEFERAALILQFDPNPCAELFRSYVPS